MDLSYLTESNNKQNLNTKYTNGLRYLYYNQNQSELEHKECAVCGLTESNRDHYQLPCQHYGHTRCIQDWIKVKLCLECPYCRDSTPTLKYCKQCDKWVDHITKECSQINESLDVLMCQSLSGSTGDIAEVLYTICQNELISFCNKINTWYKFVDHKWTTDGYKFAIIIRTKLKKKYSDLDVHYTNLSQQTHDKILISLYQQKIKLIARLIKKLDDITFVEKIIRACEHLFTNENSSTPFDSKTHLIGFDNGVYDLNEGRFRDGEPDDYITLSTRYDYQPYNANDPLLPEILAFLGQLFQEFDANGNRIDNFRDYMLLLMSSYLNGDNLNEHLNIWVGNGGNGKSKLVSLLHHTLGQYARTVPSTVFTRKLPSHTKANPCIAGLIGVRLCTTCHPEEFKHKATLHTDLIKSWTNGENIIARNIFQKQTLFKSQLKIIVDCNEVPNLPDKNESDGKLRVRIIPFKSQFVDNPNPNNKYQMKVDGWMEQKLQTWKSSFMGLLLENYKTYKITGLCKTNAISQTMNSHKNNMENSSRLKIRIEPKIKIQTKSKIQIKLKN